MGRVGGAVAALLGLVALARCSSGGSGLVTTEVNPNLPFEEGPAVTGGGTDSVPPPPMAPSTLPFTQLPDASSAYAPCDGGCGADAMCAYAIEAGCGAVGVCVPAGSSGACRSPTLCGCDGVVFLGQCGLPFGYTQAPTSGSYLACLVDAGDAGEGTGDAAGDAEDGE
jgi:hypothetical protein